MNERWLLVLLATCWSIANIAAAQEYAPGDPYSQMPNEYPPEAPVSDMPYADEPQVPHSVLHDYYSNPGEVSVDQAAHQPADGTLPLPESWTSSMFDPQPRLDVRVEAIFLEPSFQNSSPLATQTQSNGIDFGLVPVGIQGNGEASTAIRGSIEYHLNEQGSIETAGFYMFGPDQANYRLSQVDQTYYFNGTAIPLNERGYVVNAPVGFPLIATDAFVDWQFHSWGSEVNALHHFICMKGPASDLAVGVGARYLAVNEEVRLNIFNELDGGAASLASESKNNIYGPQFVGRARLNGPGQRLRWLFEGRIGLMANTADHSNEIATIESPAARNGDVETRFAPLFEGLFACEFYVWRNLVLFGGYQLLFVDRVDRAAGHFYGDINVFRQAPENLGSLFLYGPRAGLLWSF